MSKALLVHKDKMVIKVHKVFKVTKVMLDVMVNHFALMQMES